MRNETILGKFGIGHRIGLLAYWLIGLLAYWLIVDFISDILLYQQANKL
jgi:hypothetical protein